MLRKLTTLVALGMLPLVSPSGVAAQATDRIRVTVDLVRTCTVAIADLEFGQGPDASRPEMSPVEVQCPDQVPFEISISHGDSGSDRLREALRGHTADGEFEFRRIDVPPGDGDDDTLLISIHL